MKYLIIKDKKKRNDLKKKELKLFIFRAYNCEINNILCLNKAVNNQTILPNFIYFYLNSKSFFFLSFKKNNVIGIRNRCILSGRSKGIYRKYKYSRIVFRDLASKGLITGIRKVSW